MFTGGGYLTRHPPDQTPPPDQRPQDQTSPGPDIPPRTRQVPPRDQTTPPGNSRLRNTVNVRPVRILLECILVSCNFMIARLKRLLCTHIIGFLIQLINFHSNKTIKLNSGGSRISQMEGGGKNLLFGNVLPKNCMKMNEIRPRGKHASLTLP